MVTVTLELDDQCPSFRATLRKAVRVLLDRARELERSNRVPGSQAWDDENAKLDAEESEQLAAYLRGFIGAARVRSVSVPVPG